MDSEHVAEALLSVQRLMRRRVDAAMATAGVSLARWKLLAILEKQGAITPVAIANEIGQAPRTVITTLSSLIVGKFVEKKDNPADGRSYLVTITPAGSALLIKAKVPKDAAIEKLFGSLDERQRKQLFALLTLVETFDTAEGVA